MADAVSVGRTVPFTPLGGKYGYVIIDGVRLNLKSWSPTQSTSLAPVTNFNSPQDGNENVHQEDIPTTIGTTFDCQGVQDGSVTGYHPTAGDSGLGIMGYNANLFFNVSFYVSSVGGLCDIDGVSGFNFSIKAVGLAVMVGTTGGAGG